MRRLDYRAPFSYGMMAERILSAGVVVVRHTDDGWRVLLLRVYNYWDCPKGVVEPGEDPLATARREAREETGTRRSRVPLGRGVRRDARRTRTTRWRGITLLPP